MMPSTKFFSIGLILELLFAHVFLFPVVCISLLVMHQAQIHWIFSHCLQITKIIQVLVQSTLLHISILYNYSICLGTQDDWEQILHLSNVLYLSSTIYDLLFPVILILLAVFSSLPACLPLCLLPIFLSILSSPLLPSFPDSSPPSLLSFYNSIRSVISWFSSYLYTI